jgi:RimJ/RimL family protein N-acetyltransferase
MLQPMEILTTTRLVLRRLEMADFDDLYALYRDEEIRRYFPEGTLTEQETRDELTWFLQGHPRDPQLGLWATILTENRAFVGRCGLLPWTIDGRNEVEVAYLIAKAYWGRGLATEAARGLVRYGFETLGLTRLVCLIDGENVASRRVAEKAGMHFEREGRDEKGPFLLYAQEKE